MAYFKIIEKLNNSYAKLYINEKDYISLKTQYEDKLKKAILDLRELLESKNTESVDLIKKAISLHSL
jgi:hypothetical protein